MLGAADEGAAERVPARPAGAGLVGLVEELPVDADADDVDLARALAVGDRGAERKPPPSDVNGVQPPLRRERAVVVGAVGPARRRRRRCRRGARRRPGRRSACRRARTSRPARAVPGAGPQRAVGAADEDPHVAGAARGGGRVVVDDVGLRAGAAANRAASVHANARINRLVAIPSGLTAERRLRR